MPRVIRWNRSEPGEAIAAAEDALASGGIVAFPTETVWGLAVRGDDTSATQRLFELKGRPDEKPLAVYVSDTRPLPQLPPIVATFARKLTGAFWPGPLTLVLPSPAGGTTGFRCSSHVFVLGWTHAARHPIVGTSANLSGSAPLLDAEAIVRTFGDGVSVVIDDGSTSNEAASTVVSLTSTGTAKILREGAIPASLIDAELTCDVLFVCTGNTCRSPMAATIFKRMLESTGADMSRVRVSSCGVHAGYGDEASRYAITAMSELGMDLRSHRSRRLSIEIAARADHIIAMTPQHAEAVKELLGWSAKDIEVILERGISDPFGGSLDEYRRCAAQIETALERWSERLRDIRGSKQ